MISKSGTDRSRRSGDDNRQGKEQKGNGKPKQNKTQIEINNIVK